MVDNQKRTVQFDPMISDIGLETRDAASAYIKLLTDNSVNWKMSYTDGITLAIVDMQIYRKNSQTLHSAKMMLFYLLP